jgi:hypothetical protein
VSLTPLPPYALSTHDFPFRHLVSLAGRAPIGGAREVALACFVAARLAADHGDGNIEEESARASRCAAAKTWLGTLALPAPVKASVGRCAEATVVGTRNDVSREISALAATSATYLDAPSRAELDALAVALRG